MLTKALPRLLKNENHNGKIGEKEEGRTIEELRKASR